VRPVGLFRAFQHRGRLWQDFALALATGALAAYGQPGIGLWPLLLLGLIALNFWAARARSFAAAAVVGVGFGIGVGGVTTVAAREWALIVPVALTLIGTGLYALPQALLAHGIARRAYGTAAFCSTIAAWSLCMGLCDYLGFPTKGEGLAAISATPVLLGGARFFGSNVACGILVAGILGSAVRLAQLPRLSVKQGSRSFAPLGSALVLLLLASSLARLSAPAATGTLSVGIPQLNVPSAYFEYRLSLPQLSDALEDTLGEQLAELSGVDVIALTETYDGSYPLLVPKVRQRFQNYARSQQQAVLLSSYLASPEGEIYNAVGFIDSNGALVGVHRKVNLAPFGEVEFQAGSSFHSAAILPTVRAGVLICQESLLAEGPFALARDGAMVLISSTSDISFHSGLLSFEHLALTRMRAIETGRAIVWASAGGPSGAVDRWGEFVAGGPFRAPAAVRVSAELHAETTPYLRSVWLWRAAAFTTLFGLFGRRRVPGPDARRASPARGTLAGLAAALAALAFAWTLAVASAGAVELANGTPERAKRSMRELLHRTVPYLGQGSLARFRTDRAHSASGALAYYLSYYGQQTLPSTVEPRLPHPTLHDLAEELRLVQRFPTREQNYDFADPPRAPTLVRAKSGEFCVATSNRAHLVWLFSPTRGDVRELTTDEAKAMLEPYALLPDDDRELNAR